jgi:hypothetical protein
MVMRADRAPIQSRQKANDALHTIVAMKGHKGAWSQALRDAKKDKKNVVLTPQERPVK